MNPDEVRFLQIMSGVLVCCCPLASAFVLLMSCILAGRVREREEREGEPCSKD